MTQQVSSYKIFFGWKLFLFNVFILHQEQILMLIPRGIKKLKLYWSNCTICKSLWILRKWRFESLSTGYTIHLWCYIFDFSFNPFPQLPSYKYLWVQYISKERLRVCVICKKVIWTQLESLGLVWRLVNRCFVLLLVILPL